MKHYLIGARISSRRRVVAHVLRRDRRRVGAAMGMAHAPSPRQQGNQMNGWDSFPDYRIRYLAAPEGAPGR